LGANQTVRTARPVSAKGRIRVAVARPAAGPVVPAAPLGVAGAHWPRSRPVPPATT